MATGPAAVKAIAEATGIPVGTVDRVARVLKQHQPPLWARSIPGNGAKSEHVRPEHLVNIAIGLTGESIADAAERVLWLGNLVPMRAGGSTPFIPGQTLAAALEHCIEALSELTTRTEFQRQYADIMVNIKQHGSRMPFAIIQGIPDRNKIGAKMCMYVAKDQDKARASASLPGGSITTEKTFTQFLLCAMSDIWSDTKAHYALSGS